MQAKFEKCHSSFSVFLQRLLKIKAIIKIILNKYFVYSSGIVSFILRPRFEAFSVP